MPQKASVATVALRTVAEDATMFEMAYVGGIQRPRREASSAAEMR